MKVGIVVAMQSELDVMLTRGEYTIDKVGAYKVYSMTISGKDVVIVKLAHVGAICAASATQLLITSYNVDIIMNFGVVGALTDSAKLCDVMLVDSVVHYDMDTSAIDHCPVGKYEIFDSVVIPTSAKLLQLARHVAPNMPVVRCASGDKFIEDIAVKNHIATTYNAQICDMELAGIVITAHLFGVEVLSVKAVSDSLVGDGNEFWDNLASACSSYVSLVASVLEAL